MSVRIKICGIAEPEDALAAVDAGADLIGLNFVPGTPRALELPVAERIAEAVAGRAERVAVFRDPEPAELDRVLRRIEFERVQLHGETAPEIAAEIDLPAIVALRGADAEVAERCPGCVLLLDHPSGEAGRGAAWDWSGAAPLIEQGYDVLLAGGLHPDNVGTALRSAGDIPPWGVDVATGVEGETPRRKDPALLRVFVEAVRKAESEAET